MPTVTIKQDNKIKKTNKKNIKNILFTLPKPESNNNLYSQFESKNNLKIDFIPFIHVLPLDDREAKAQKIEKIEYQSVLFTSKHAVDHFFTLNEKLEIEIQNETKYFCFSETIAHYLQKYIHYRKRKVFFAKSNPTEIEASLERFKDDQIIVPTSNIHIESNYKFLLNKGYKLKHCTFFKIQLSKLVDFDPYVYDMIVFYSPYSIEALIKAYPSFKQKQIILAAFGTNTQRTVQQAGFELQILAPTKKTPSIVSAIEDYIKKC